MHKIAKTGPKGKKSQNFAFTLQKKSKPARKKYITPVVAVVTSMRYGTLYVSQHTKFTERKTILQLLPHKVDVETEVHLQTTGPQDHKTTQKKNIFAWALPPPSACLPFVVWIIHKTSQKRKLMMEQYCNTE